MEKFKIGDKVDDKIIKDWRGIVVRVSDNSCDILADNGDMYVGLSCDYFNFIHSFTKNDLKNGDIVTLKNSDKLIYVNNYFYDTSSTYGNCLYRISDLNDDMMHYSSNNRESDIIKVSRPVEYIEVFSRPKEPKKMTVSEICKELGCDVEIVKEGE